LQEQRRISSAGFKALSQHRTATNAHALACYVEETEVTLHDTVFWGMRRQHDDNRSFFVSCQLHRLVQTNGVTPVGADLGKVVVGHGHHAGAW